MNVPAMLRRPVPQPLTLAAAITSGVVLLSALAMIAACLALAKVPPWSMLGFEAVVAIACGFGVANARFRSAPALAILCVAACVFAGSVLGYIGVRGVLDRGNEVRVALRPWLLGRLGASALLAGLAAWAVLRREPRSTALALRALVWGVPVLAAGALGAVWGSRITGALDALPGWARAGTYLVLALLLAVSLCASGHFLIRAFQLGCDATDPSAHPPGTGSTPTTGARSS